MSSSSDDNNSDNKSSNLFVKILYFTSLAGASILFGFSRSLSKIRKTDIVATTEEAKLHEEAVALARKALFKGTIYSVSGFSAFALISYGIYSQLTSQKSNKK